MQLERSLATVQPLEQVFDYMSQFHRCLEWDPSVVHAEKLTTGVATLGARFAVDVRLMGRLSRFVYTIVKIEEPFLIELVGEGEHCTATDRITLAQDANGTTQMHYALTLKFSPFFEKIEPLLAPFVERMADASMLGLKRTLDDEALPVRRYAGWLDKMIVPGALQFTRYGFFWSKKHWKGIPRLDGKTVVVTGASSGLGRAATFMLAERGANVIAVVRDEDKGVQLANEVARYCLQPIRVETCDLSSIRATLLLASKWLDEDLPLHALINNAGALYNERELTSENLEKSFALLLLSPFVLTESLLPLLGKSGEGRVVNVVSGGLYTQAVHLDDLYFEREAYDGPKAYARAKRGLLDMTRLWAEKFGDRNIHFHAMHPGWADTQGVIKSLPAFHKVMRSVLRSPEQGADTMVWLAAASEALQCNGEFWLDRKTHTSSVVPGTESSPELREKLYGELLDQWAVFNHGNVRIKKNKSA